MYRKNMTRKKIIIVLGLINLSLFFGQLVFSATRATDGEVLSQIYQELSQIKADNQNLRSEIYSLSSLEMISQKAGDLQMTRIATQFVTGSLPVAAAF